MSWWWRSFVTSPTLQQVCDSMQVCLQTLGCFDLRSLLDSLLHCYESGWRFSSCWWSNCRKVFRGIISISRRLVLSSGEDRVVHSQAIRLLACSGGNRFLSHGGCGSLLIPLQAEQPTVVGVCNDLLLCNKNFHVDKRNHELSICNVQTWKCLMLPPLVLHNKLTCYSYGDHIFLNNAYRYRVIAISPTIPRNRRLQPTKAFIAHVFSSASASSGQWRKSVLSLSGPTHQANIMKQYP